MGKLAGEVFIYLFIMGKGPRGLGVGCPWARSILEQWDSVLASPGVSLPSK